MRKIFGFFCSSAVSYLWRKIYLSFFFCIFPSRLRSMSNLWRFDLVSRLFDFRFFVSLFWRTLKATTRCHTNEMREEKNNHGRSFFCFDLEKMFFFNFFVYTKILRFKTMSAASEPHFLFKKFQVLHEMKKIHRRKQYCSNLSTATKF